MTVVRNGALGWGREAQCVRMGHKHVESHKERRSGLGDFTASL